MTEKLTQTHFNSGVDYLHLCQGKIGGRVALVS